MYVVSLTCILARWVGGRWMPAFSISRANCCATRYDSEHQPLRSLRDPCVLCTADDDGCMSCVELRLACDVDVNVDDVSVAVFSACTSCEYIPWLWFTSLMTSAIIRYIPHCWLELQPKPLARPIGLGYTERRSNRQLGKHKGFQTSQTCMAKYT